jgi:hypothetical protein
MALLKTKTKKLFSASNDSYENETKKTKQKAKQNKNQNRTKSITKSKTYNKTKSKKALQCING